MKKHSKKSKENNGPKVGELILDLLEKSAYLSVELLTLLANKSYKGYRPGGGSSQAFYTKLNQFKRNGLIEKGTLGEDTSWQISKKGKDFLNKKRDKFNAYLTAPISPRMKIVSYDIPEKYRRGRGWLRSVLKLMDYEMVHQSVWIGRKVLPKDFFEVIANEGLEEYLKIFEVTKSGSLNPVRPLS